MIHRRAPRALVLPSLLVALLALGSARARADGPFSGAGPSGDSDGDAAILGRPAGWQIDSLRARYTHIEQRGRGYQSQADAAPGRPGLEDLTVDQPQIEVVAHQGDRVTHRLWVPLDVITAASPDALDAISTASRTQEAGSVDLTSTYRVDRDRSVFGRAMVHVEENFLSWQFGLGGNWSLADDNTTLALSIQQAADSFDQYTIHGVRIGHVTRSTTNLNFGLTQLLSPTTIVHLDYGGTIQTGVLGNTWNAVPIGPDDHLDAELLPTLRHRHAFVARIAQALPWHGALKGYYRFYVDSWGVIANTVEVELFQRLTRWLYARASYRFHQQTGVSFYTESADPSATYRTADSDLAPFFAHDFGIKLAMDLPIARGGVRMFHVDLGYDRYFRTNSLEADLYSGSIGFRF